MALATLCSKLRQTSDGKGLSFTAFIVDHGLRSGSDDEARTVATHLKLIGTSCHVVYESCALLTSVRYTVEDHHSQSRAVWRCPRHTKSRKCRTQTQISSPRIGMPHP